MTYGDKRLSSQEERPQDLASVAKGKPCVAYQRPSSPKYRECQPSGRSALPVRHESAEQGNWTFDVRGHSQTKPGIRASYSEKDACFLGAWSRNTASKHDKHNMAWHALCTSAGVMILPRYRTTLPSSCSNAHARLRFFLGTTTWSRGLKHELARVRGARAC